MSINAPPKMRIQSGYWLLMTDYCIYRSLSNVKFF